jgi:O-succinylbenzoate synthase
VVVADVHLYRYELPLTAPLRLGDATLRHRRGLLLRVDTEQGAVGWGDAAPLPGFSDETLSAVVACARDAVPRWTGTEIPDGEAALDRSLAAHPLGPEAPPSLRFAMESAVVMLLAAARDTSVPVVLGDARSTVALNALITHPEDDGPGQADRYREQGYRAVKVKVGRGAVEADAKQIRAIHRALGDSVALRADANRAWSLEEAAAFSEATREVPIAYVEEPLADPSQLSDLAGQTDLPIALDETTREVEPEFLRDGPSVTAVVLKPTLLGGVQKTRAWSRTAREHGATPVLSAAYESGVGLRMLVALAAVGPDTPVGLSTYDRLAADVLRTPLRVDGPVIDVASVADAPASVDDERVDHVAL